MADSKITALASISTATDPAVDPLVIVDVSDTSMAASGTSKKVTLNNLLSSSPTATGAFSVTGLVTAGSATITGALTTQGTQVKLASQGGNDCTVFIGPDVPAATYSGRIGFLTTNTYKNWNVLNSWNTVGAFEIAQNTTVGGSVLSSNPTFRINSDNSFNFLDGAGGTRMTLNSTGLGIGVSPAYKGDFNGNIRSMKQGDRTDLAFLIDGTASPNWLQRNVIGHYYNTAYSQDALSIRSPSSALANTASYDIISGGAHLWFLAGGSTANGSTATQAMTLDATGNLSLGQSSSALQSAGKGITIFGTSASEIKFLNSITGTSDTDGTALVTGSYNFSINNREAGTVTIGTSNTNRIVIEAAGDVTISTGDVVMSNGKGISFAAKTPDGSGTVGSEVLNDYEEGTWQGTLKGSVSDPTTAVVATGRYTKIGRQVSVQIAFETVTTTGASGAIAISGLPFTNSASIRVIGTAGVYLGATFTGTLISVVSSSATTVDINGINSNAIWSSADHNTGTGRFFWVNLTYTV